MAFAIWQAYVTDGAGNIVPNANFSVKRWVPGAPLADIYADENAASPLDNPDTADANGKIEFYARGGFYTVRAWLGPSSAPTFETTWPKVAIGTAAGADVEDLITEIGLTPRGAWLSSEVYALNNGSPDLVEHEGYIFISNEDDNIGNEPQTNPAASDAHWTLFGIGSGGLTSASDSEVEISLSPPEKFFTVAVGLSWGIGARLRARSVANPETHWIEGVAAALDGGSLTLEADLVGDGEGDSRSDWIIGLTGERGATGDVTPEVEAAQAAAEAAAVQAALQAAKLIGTSTTSLTIGTGTKIFATQEDKFFDPGAFVMITSDAAPSTNYMFGQVTAYAAGSLEVAVIATGGSGTHADWTIRVAGARGPQGPSGSLDFSVLPTGTPALADKLVFGDVDDSDIAKGATFAEWREALGIPLSFKSASNPTEDENYAAGYVNGDTWVNTSTLQEFVLVDDASGDSPPAAVWVASAHLKTIEIVLGSIGVALATGVKGYFEVSFAGEIVAARALGDQSGSVVVDIWKDTYANYPPADADSITAAAPITISAADKSEDTTLTGWTKSFSAGDIFGFNVDSVDTIQQVTISLTVRVKP